MTNLISNHNPIGISDDQYKKNSFSLSILPNMWIGLTLILFLFITVSEVLTSLSNFNTIKRNYEVSVYASNINPEKLVRQDLYDSLNKPAVATIETEDSNTTPTREYSDLRFIDTRAYYLSSECSNWQTQANCDLMILGGDSDFMTVGDNIETELATTNIQDYTTLKIAKTQVSFPDYIDLILTKGSASEDIWVIRWDISQQRIIQTFQILDTDVNYKLYFR